jgi:hypothetical protein
MVHYILKGDRTPSPEMSVAIEGATGVCREAWLWPERHWNPYIPVVDTFHCPECPNRIRSIIFAHNEIMKELSNCGRPRTHGDKKRVLAQIVSIAWEFMQFPPASVVSFREIIPAGFELLAYKCGDVAIKTSFSFMPVIPKDIIPNAYQDYQTPGFVTYSRHFPEDLPEHWAQERELLAMKNIKTLLTVSSGKLLYSYGCTNGERVYTPETIEFVKGLVMDYHKAIYGKEPL